MISGGFGGIEGQGQHGIILETGEGSLMFPSDDDT